MNFNQVLQKLNEGNQLKPGTKVEFLDNIDEVSPGDFGMDQEEYDEMMNYVGDVGVITSIELDNGDGEHDHTYYNVKFPDGYVLAAISGYHLEAI